MNNYSDLTKKQQKQVRDETGYNKEQLETEDPLLIPDYKFEDYAYDLAQEYSNICVTDWPFTCIDWNRAADELRHDYTSLTVDDSEYLIGSW